MRFRSILGLAVLLIVGCAKDSATLAKNDPTAAKPPVSGNTNTDIPASGQAQVPPSSPPPTVSATATPPATAGTPATAPPTSPKPGATPPSIKPAPAATTSANVNLYTFKYAPKESELNYKLTMSMDMGTGQPMDMTSTMTNKISKNKDGTYTVVSTANSPTGFGAAGGPQSSTSIVDSKGRIVSTKGKGMGTKSDPFGTTSFSNALPDHPVKIGDTWNASEGGKSGGTMVCKLVKVDKTGGSPVATIEIVKMSIPTGGMMTMKLTKPARVLMEVATGVMRSMNIDAEMGLQSPPSGASSAPAGTPKSIKVHMKMDKQ